MRQLLTLTLLLSCSGLVRAQQYCQPGQPCYQPQYYASQVLPQLPAPQQQAQPDYRDRAAPAQQPQQQAVNPWGFPQQRSVITGYQPIINQQQYQGAVVQQRQGWYPGCLVIEPFVRWRQRAQYQQVMPVYR